MSLAETAIYALLWLSFGVAHSLLASVAVKSYLHSFLGPSYRLCYNVVSTLHIGLVVFGGRMLLVSSPVSIHLVDGFENAFFGMRLIGVCVLLVALKQYDLGRFSGLSQLRCGSAQVIYVKH